MASFIPIPPCLVFADDLHGVEPKDKHFLRNFIHRKVPVCKNIQIDHLQRCQNVKEKWFNEKMLEANNVSY
jgi:hypothetical protein